MAQPPAAPASAIAAAAGKEEKSKITRKDSGKKSAQEKRDIFKGLHG
jgi:hypothetical protein